MLSDFSRGREMVDGLESEYLKLLYYDLPPLLADYKTYEYSRLCTIIDGSKHISLNGGVNFTYYPGHFVLLPPSSTVQMKIDVPTKALVFELNKELVKKVTEKMAMHFTNPRHIKKVLNKYLLIRYYQASGLDRECFIPDQKGEFFQYLTLFIIMLYKFEPENFIVIRDYDKKISTYFEKSIIKGQKNEGGITTMLINGNIKAMTIQDMRGACAFGKNYGIAVPNTNQVKENRFLAAFITLFSPSVNEYIIFTASNVEAYKNQFEGQYNLPSNFCSFINATPNLIPITDAQYRLWNIFDMAERYL